MHPIVSLKIRTEPHPPGLWLLHPGCVHCTFPTWPCRARPYGGEASGWDAGGQRICRGAPGEVTCYYLRDNDVSKRRSENLAKV